MLRLLAIVALMLLPATPAPAQAHAPGCPGAAIGFAPPLGSPLQLVRIVERDVSGGRFVQTIRYRIVFERAGRGYRMRWLQLGSEASGPPGLLRLLALHDDSAQGESLDVTLDATGRPIGVAEPPDAAARLAAAIARLRSDPELTRRPASEQAAIGAMLDRIAALPPAERADLQRAKAARLLVLAGGRCSAGRIAGNDGDIYTVARSAERAITLVAHQSERRADGSALDVETEVIVDPVTGLIASHDRRSASRTDQGARTNRDWLRLSAEPQAPDPAPGNRPGDAAFEAVKFEG